MKTLDEVITEMEDEGVFPDALQWLQTYRADKLEWEQTRQANEERYQEAVKNCERAENKFITRLKELNIGTLNDPLSWEELRTMEGKPIWVEQTFTHKKYTGWVINKGTDELALITDARSFDRATYGKTWQAYRKEHGTDS